MILRPPKSIRTDTLLPYTKLFRSQEAGAGDDWTDYGGTPEGLRFTRLAQITPKNVAGLTPVWTYSFGDAEPYNLQIAPLKIGGLVYACNSTNVVVALDAASGKQVWRFDPKPDLRSAPFRACKIGRAHV